MKLQYISQCVGNGLIIILQKALFENIRVLLYIVGNEMLKNDKWIEKIERILSNKIEMPSIIHFEMLGKIIISIVRAETDLMK